MSRWLSATSVEYLVVAATATAGAAAVVAGLHTPHRRWASACLVALTLSLALGANTQHQSARLNRDWPAERARMSDAAVAMLAKRVDEATAELRVLATQSLAASADRGAAFQDLADA